MQDRFFMALSVFLRMAVGLVVFVLLARQLGPRAYAVVGTVFSYAMLASLLTDFGLASKTLRDIAAEPQHGIRLLNDSLSVKFYLTGAVLLFSLPALCALNIPWSVRISSVLIGAAVLLAAIGDHAFTAYRALGRYRMEAWITVWTSAIHVGLVGTVALMHGKLLFVAVAFFVSRALYMTVILTGSSRLFDNYRLRTQNLRNSLLMMRESWGWAADSGLNYLNAQIDGLVVIWLFGLHSAGIYQAGARFPQAALGLVAVLANVHIPRLAALNPTGRWPISRLEVLMFVEFTSIGGAIALFFWLGGPWLTHHLLGDQFAETNTLWPAFAVFVLLRFMASSIGAALTSRNVPLLRVGGQVLCLSTVVYGLFIVAPHHGVAVLPWIMASGSLVILLAYSVGRLSFTFSPEVAK